MLENTNLGVFLSSSAGKKTVQGLLSGVSFLSGSVLTYIWSKKHLEMKYAQQAADEIADARIFYAKLHKTGPFASPTTLLEVYDTALDDLEYVSPASRDNAGAALRAEGEKFIRDLDASVERIQNIFDETPGDFDYAEEIAKRSEDSPYVIHHDEFYEGVKDYQQITLTYFEEDDVLCDENEKPMDDVDDVVGEDNLTLFGHGSKDNNVVYVRNDRLGLDFEIVRSKGNYAKEVLGFVEHSDRGLRKFRRDYE